METIKYKPSVKPTPSGFYKVNCNIFPDGKQKGKIVMAEIVNEIECRLLANKKHDDTWIKSTYKKGWFEKAELIENVIFFNLN